MIYHPLNNKNFLIKIYFNLEELTYHIRKKIHFIQIWELVTTEHFFELDPQEI